MKAVIYAEHGPPPVFKLMELDKPVPKDDEILVKVHAASVNSWDWGQLDKSPSRAYTGKRGDPKYKVLGADISGIVDSVGSEITKFKPGDEVMGDLCTCGWGGFGEFARARKRTTRPAFHKPAAVKPDPSTKSTPIIQSMSTAMIEKNLRATPK